MGFWKWLNATYDDDEFAAPPPNSLDARTDVLCAKCMKAALSGVSAFKRSAVMNAEGFPPAAARALVECVYFTMFYCHAKGLPNAARDMFYHKFLYNLCASFTMWRADERELLGAYFTDGLDAAGALYTQCTDIWGAGADSMASLLCTRLERLTKGSAALSAVRTALREVIASEKIDAALAAV